MEYFLCGGSSGLRHMPDRGSFYRRKVFMVMDRGGFDRGGMAGASAAFYGKRKVDFKSAANGRCSFTAAFGCAGLAFKKEHYF